MKCDTMHVTHEMQHMTCGRWLLILIKTTIDLKTLLEPIIILNGLPNSSDFQEISLAYCIIPFSKPKDQLRTMASLKPFCTILTPS